MKVVVEGHDVYETMKESKVWGRVKLNRMLYILCNEQFM